MLSRFIRNDFDLSHGAVAAVGEAVGDPTRKHSCEGSLSGFSLPKAALLELGGLEQKSGGARDYI